ncbi:hypothetical protein OUZ56_011251 [Daphnia magna]|uniref:Uncharacterized protein n=1 Tax=Daphnia magna TaxID=35525 RepID=A0ABQ9YZN5_9CRUS|nr:hypothetical protein OUZ56_011251 [Daphnia magna]
MNPMSLLKRMMTQAIQQSGKKKKGRRYQVLSDFSVNIWILGGRHTYELLHDNLPGIFVSPRTVRAELEKYNASCMPGVIHLDVLLEVIRTNRY